MSNPLHVRRPRSDLRTTLSGGDGQHFGHRRVASSNSERFITSRKGRGYLPEASRRRRNPLDGTIDVPLQSWLIASRVLTPFPIRRNDSIRDIAAQKALPSMRAVTGAFDIF